MSSVWDNLFLKVSTLFNQGWRGFKTHQLLILKLVSMRSLKEMMDMAGLQTMAMCYFKFLDSIRLCKFRSIFHCYFLIILQNDLFFWFMIIFQELPAKACSTTLFNEMDLVSPIYLPLGFENRTRHQVVFFLIMHLPLFYSSF